MLPPYQCSAEIGTVDTNLLIYIIFAIIIYNLSFFSGSVCGGQCCDNKTETLLRKQSQRDFAALLRHNSRSLQGLLTSTAITLQSKFLIYSSNAQHKTKADRNKNWWNRWIIGISWKTLIIFRFFCFCTCFELEAVEGSYVWMTCITEFYFLFEYFFGSCTTKVLFNFSYFRTALGFCLNPLLYIFFELRNMLFHFEDIWGLGMKWVMMGNR